MAPGFSWKRPTRGSEPAEDLPQDFAVARKRMVADHLVKRGITEEAILRTMLKVPRHLFVEEALGPMAYNDHSLHIGRGQTISQPFIVAKMLEALELKPQDRILEIGTGCGYLTALLSELVAHVYSVERISDLLLKARKVLKRLGYKNITLRLGDGTLGWSKHAPFDAIVVSAASPQIPQPYLDQLKEGGRMILPVGGEAAQELTRIRRVGKRVERMALTGCRFVKLKGEHGFKAS